MSFTQVFWCTNIAGVVVDPAFTIWEQGLEFPDDPMSFSVTTHLGYPAVLVELGVDPAIDRYIYVYNGMAAGEFHPARAALECRAFSFEGGFTIGPDYSPSSWPLIDGRFRAVVVPFIAAAIDAFTNGSTAEPVFYTIASAGGVVNQTRAVIPIYTDAEVLAFTCSVVGMNAVFPDTRAYCTGRALPAPANGGVQPGMEKGLNEIARAVNLIAKTSRVTWINNQGGFADIMTGDIVTEGGGD